jgi:hypothetical protein
MQMPLGSRHRLGPELASTGRFFYDSARIVDYTQVDRLWSLVETHVVTARHFDLCRERLRDCAGPWGLCYAPVDAICET